jgi:hypothetical protein
VKCMPLSVVSVKLPSRLPSGNRSSTAAPLQRTRLRSVSDARDSNPRSREYSIRSRTPVRPAHGRTRQIFLRRAIDLYTRECLALEWTRVLRAGE